MEVGDDGLPPSPAPTMEEVARAAGVSKMTVSRVVNWPETVAAETRERVSAAMRRVGYVPRPRRPDAAGRRRRGPIALIITDVTNPFFTRVARGVEDVANQAGYAVILGNSDEDTAKEREYLETLVAERLEGVILVPAGRESRENVRVLEDHSVPFVLCDRRLPGLRADVVLGDSVGGARRLVAHLLEIGHRHIAFIGGNRYVSTAVDRRAGYEQALRDAGRRVDPRFIVELGYTVRAGVASVDALLSRGIALDAIVAANNALASGVVVRLKDLGLRIPEDIALACFDELEGLVELYPYFTVMAQPALNFGTISAQMLLERIQGRIVVPPREVVLIPELIVRRSSGIPVGDS